MKTLLQKLITTIKYSMGRVNPYRLYIRINNIEKVTRYNRKDLNFLILHQDDYTLQVEVKLDDMYKEWNKWSERVANEFKKLAVHVKDNESSIKDLTEELNLKFKDIGSALIKLGESGEKLAIHIKDNDKVFHERLKSLENYQQYQDNVIQELESKLTKAEKSHTMLHEFVMKEFYRNHKLPKRK